jgi:lipid-A-disaccharide synthase
MQVAMVAGETSGDLLAGLLLDGMVQRWSDLSTMGIGGPSMCHRGFEAWWPHEKLAVHGFGWDVLLRYHEIVGIRKQLKSRLLLQRPDLFIGVDAPDFNLDLEHDLRINGIKTIHFVCPSVWAWRAHRIEKLKRSCDHVLCIFPFEPTLLAQHGISASYVGHPLANVIPIHCDRSAARARLGLQAEDTVVAILPGSRRSEIAHLCLRFFHAAALIQKALPATKFIVPVIPSLKSEVQAIARASGMDPYIQLVDGQSHSVLAACDVTLIASGTATLEAALFKRPMVIAYHMSSLSWQIMKRKRLQAWVGLPNILCQEFVVPELLQEAATPQALAQEVLNWLTDLSSGSARIRKIEHRFGLLHQELQRNTAELASDAITKILQH